MGFRLRARRLATVFGELDLVLERANELWVVEVKCGVAGPRFRPADRLARAQLERQARAARALARARGRETWTVALFEVVRRPGAAPEGRLLPLLEGRA